MGKFRLALIIFLMTSLSVSSKLLPKVYDIEYHDQALHYFYEGTKASVRLSGVPYSADVVQVTAASGKGAPKALILGKRNIPVQKGAGSSYIEFNLEIEDVDFKKTFNKAIVLKIKCFAKNPDGSFDVVDKITNFIRPKMCTDKDEKVCAITKPPCRQGRACIEVYRTFRNECEMDRHGGVFIHPGVCDV